MKSKSGCTPLIYASGRKNLKINEEIFNLLIEKYPDAIHIKDNLENLPLNYLATTNNVKLVKKVISMHPDSVFSKNIDDKIPSDFINLGSTYSNEMILEFYKHNPQPHLLNPKLINLLFKYIEKNILSETSINILASLVAAKKYYTKKDLISSLLEKILLKYKESDVKILYNSVDKFGSKISEISSEKCRKVFQKIILFRGKYEYISDEPLYKTTTSIVMLAKCHETNIHDSNLNNTKTSGN